MNIKENRIQGIGILAIVTVVFIIGFWKVGNRLTYIERTVINEKEEKEIAVMDNRTVLEQEFAMPYGLFWGIDIKTGTYGRNNNSFWKLDIREKESGKIIYEWEYNASQVSDGEKYLCKVTSPIKVDKGKEYILSIRSKNATGNSALCFYASGHESYGDGKFFINGEVQEGALCIRVYGGEKDLFWSFLYVIMTGAVAGILALVFYQKKKGESAKKLLGALGVACIYILLMYVFSRENMGTFTDECDNIRGGMLIAGGKVLYRDYYTQHTPFGYYLCAVFALLGAGSIQQFRLLYYLLSAMLWGGLYYRHCNFFGKRKMFILPIAQIIIIIPMFFQASKILGDNIQGFCMIALIMEFIRYWDDGRLEKSRCIIVSACVFASIASTFVSVFAITPIAICVLVREGLFWKGKEMGREMKGGDRVKRIGTKGVRIKAVWRRYGFFLPVALLPFLVSMVYFVLARAAGQMYLMAYQFNTMVYNKYQNEFGKIKWKPFFLGLKSYFDAIGDNFNAMLSSGGNDIVVIQFLIAVGAIVSLMHWWRRMGEKEGIAAVLALLLCMSGNGTRGGMGFHAVGLWNVALTIIILLGIPEDSLKDGVKGEGRKRILACMVAAGCYLLRPYISMVVEHVVYHPNAVDETDEQIVSLTEPGEGIFIDTYVHDSIYLMYKERYPVNRNCYILPWYMDWFEYDTVEDLVNYAPRIVVYQPQTEEEGETICPSLDAAIRERYERVSEDSLIWKLN